LGHLTGALSAQDRDTCAAAAMDAWGTAGIAVRRGGNWLGVVLVCPADAIPRGHPLAAGGLDPRTAALLLAYIAPSASRLRVGRRLSVGLGRYLRGHVTGVEAQAAPASILGSALAPSPHLLTHMGFQPVRYPVNRYRLDFATMATWVQKALAWYRRPVLVSQLLPANRASHRT